MVETHQRLDDIFVSEAQNTFVNVVQFNQDFEISLFFRVKEESPEWLQVRELEEWDWVGYIDALQLVNNLSSLHSIDRLSQLVQYVIQTVFVRLRKLLFLFRFFVKNFARVLALLLAQHFPIE